MRAEPRLGAAVAADRLRLPSVEPVRTGMPELCRAGLSETWLFKACGHRHWLALARAHGLSKPAFRDEAGARLYPAFTSVTVADGKLDSVGEDELLRFDVTLIRIGRTRFRSEILVLNDAEIVARVTMESAFVRRAVDGRNRSATRALAAGPCSLISPPTGVAPPLRVDGWDHQAHFMRSERTGIATHWFDLSPHEDFNGADFLYFAAFQAMLDRAEWRWLRRENPLLVTAERQILYVGNIELGDQVGATLCGLIEEREHRVPLDRIVACQRWANNRIGLLEAAPAKRPAQ